MAASSMMIYGKNSVLERLRAHPQSVEKVFVAETAQDHRIEALAKRRGIPVHRIPAKQLARFKQNENLQGFAARVAPFAYTYLEDVLGRPRRDLPAIIFLDGVYDPQNLGSIIRTAACFGGFHIVIPGYRSCDVTETVLHVASGGENYVGISKVANLSHAIRMAKEGDYWIAGAVTDRDAQDIYTASLPFPLGILLGSEGAGIAHAKEKLIDMSVRIPMKGVPLSLNVSIAAAVLISETVRARSYTKKLHEGKESV